MEREQLADFLRRRRQAIRPAEVGIADGPRRRTRGLRREEVAMLAGMSVDYVVRLEQGRSSQPSAQLLVALARALRLSDDERDHLFHLAGHRPPPADGTARMARAGLVRMLDLLGDTPAAVMSDLGEMLAQNRASLLLMSDHTGFRGDRRYMIYRWFTEPEVRAVCPPEDRDLNSRRLVADLRADRKTLLHPRVGRLLLDCETLVTPDQGQELLVLTPADTETRERMELLRVLGSEEFPTGTADRDGR
ncbi:helix-turn-helix transcriptional regulator [Streptomyces albogriseolus]|uniref:helix-turn-helix transcriptional regulator n=1 Tax=Streptomyces albogriseolus TaxID=1887 RepID=UPI0037B593BA